MSSEASSDETRAARKHARMTASPRAEAHRSRVRSGNVEPPAVRAVEEAVRAWVHGPPLVLAVSGGRDSMVLLDAFADNRPTAVAAVATFDHGTGPAAKRAVALVRARARALGLEIRVGQAAKPRVGEAAWREDRWRFLRAVARELGAPVATAHSRDDQIETVAMRILRGAGARGLAALYAPSRIVRPFLRLPRDTLARYAAARRVRWVEDPSNGSRRFLRNRLRLDLLPALRAAAPGLERDLLVLARCASRWRADVEELASTLGARSVGGTLRVPADALSILGDDALGVLWPSLAALENVTLDRRGTMRLAAFTRSSRAGAAMPLSGSVEVIRGRGEFILRRRPAPDPRSSRSLHGTLRFGEWRFVRGEARAGDPWTAELPGDPPLTVRAWRAGDRMWVPGVGARRVKRFFRDVRIVGPERAGWPVVLAGDEIVWIPGVRRAAHRPTDHGSHVGYRCERVGG